MTKIFSSFIYYLLFAFSKIILFLTKRNILLYIYEKLRENSLKKIEIKGKKIKFFNPNTIINWRLETFFIKEPETLEWIDQFSSEKEILFWDIGSNIGLYSIYAATIHKNIKVIAFEPSTLNLNALSKNIFLNKLEDKIMVAQFALTDHPNKFLKMRETSILEGGALSAYGVDYDDYGKEIKNSFDYKIYGTTVDYLIDQKILKIPHYIKIDVDGIEHLILEGANAMLSSKSIKGILVELNEDFLEQYEFVCNSLLSKGFKLKVKTRSKMVEEDHKRSSVYNFIFTR